MFIDASAIVAILNKEPGWEELAKRLDASRKPVYFSAVARYEAVLGLARATSRTDRKPSAEMVKSAQALVDELLDEIEARNIAISAEIGEHAITAAAAFGKAVGHKADVNMGDCFAYACAKSHRLALLYKGNDFGHTDIEAA